MNNPKITSVGIAAALLLFSSLLFGQRADAGEIFPAGTYGKGSYIMDVKSDGDYRVTQREGVTTKVITGGFALYEGDEVCFSNDKKGNLWVVDEGGEGSCYRAAVRGNHIIIDKLDSNYKPLGGIWVKYE